MNRNLVNAAIDQVDSEPSFEYLRTLRAQLLADLTEPVQPNAGTPDTPNSSSWVSVHEHLTEAPSHSHGGRNRRVPRLLLAAAALIALFASAAVIANRPNQDLNKRGTLNDVSPQEAAPLAQAALITPDDLGSGWLAQDAVSDTIYAEQAAATIEALPQCTVLTSVGLFPPTTKSVVARQYFTDRLDFDSHTVFVFASPEDASRAMDIIAADIFPACWFSFLDRLTPLGSPAHRPQRSTSSAWEAPTIAAHGDQQVIIGQHSRFPASRNTPVERYGINAFVRVGRAISWINPRYDFVGAAPLLGPDKAIDAAVNALKVVVGT